MTRRVEEVPDVVEVAQPKKPPYIEVLAPDVRAHYRAVVHDMDQANHLYLVSYALEDYLGDAKHTINNDLTRASHWVPESCLSERTQAPWASTRSLVVGDAVEVQCLEEGRPGAVGWWEGSLVALLDEGNSWHVRFPDGSEEVVRKEARLRPAGIRKQVDLGKLIIPVPEWVKADVIETREVMHEVVSGLGVCSVNLRMPMADFIEILGPRPTLGDAQLAVVVHFNRASEFSRLAGIHRLLHARLEIARQAQIRGHVLEFNVSNDMIGACIGKSGCNLKQAQQVAGIRSIEVLDAPGGNHRIRIAANHAEAAEEAREILEHVRARVSVDQLEIGLVIGKKGVHLREIEERTGVSKFVLVENHDEEQSPRGRTCFETVGRRKNIEAATKLFRLHREFLQKQRNMEDQVRQLRSGVSSLYVSWPRPRSLTTNHPAPCGTPDAHGDSEEA
mmetsp:Transcript_2682/g.4868  ORF Transcript_2682/g.4868 Transcript_2682/m.4868 type:complete len:447 (-) Transcript_2682:111-1451(-)|eukprot:CAMPEP_0184686230 /NCGR_PEP_ID=MMETSP0312-20130426/21721_1 /TAXON_ID=31354 /ORGANISM="Compsopogon coeruleus, Strain SAG 36.94" /LENGTH=446 /DNA_ID=CAMNT_0027141111 /DNA_START=148 /DNA_END=1488 /DNA_ORIENTATION=-